MVETLKFLLETSPDTINCRDKHGTTVFQLAVRTDASCERVLPVLDVLLDGGVDRAMLNVQVEFGVTVLHGAVLKHACCGGEHLMELLDVLIKNGADASVRNDKRRNVLHQLAIDSRGKDLVNAAMLDILLESVGVKDLDRWGCTALHYIVQNFSQINAVRHLISRGADVNMVNRFGDTPLHEVIRGTLARGVDKRGHIEPMGREDVTKALDDLVKVLQDAGASMDKPNRGGKTPPQIRDDIFEERRRLEEARRQGRGRPKGGSSLQWVRGRQWRS
ncbi:ankyrin [Aspergillus ellipticus CBS 707.79]|uniref:Ankyrin n=1 Tax=Aspergillus ellipticus CBS 707.79 TaxID=1448320 RepID=A0A319EH97_9EURO|nr:ankyrin [Aspergillus ellipticus CBS 707.79]